MDIRIARNPHLSFGFGPHTCLGNHIAEIEAKVFLKVLLETQYNWRISPESKINFYEAAMVKVPQHFESVQVLTN